jgi:hypothetical protein
VILTNGNKSSSFRSFLTHGAPLAYEVTFIKVEGIADTHILLFCPTTSPIFIKIIIRVIIGTQKHQEYN